MPYANCWVSVTKDGPAGGSRFTGASKPAARAEKSGSWLLDPWDPLAPWGEGETPVGLDASEPSLGSGGGEEVAE